MTERLPLKSPLPAIKTSCWKQLGCHSKQKYFRGGTSLPQNFGLDSSTLLIEKRVQVKIGLSHSKRLYYRYKEYFCSLSWHKSLGDISLFHNRSTFFQKPCTIVQNLVFSYVLPYVVKFGEPRWEKWLAWDENMHHSKHSSKFWLRGYLWFSFKGPLKLLNKRPRPKHELCNNSVIFWLIWMKFGMQLSYGPPFPLAKIQQGHEGQRP